MMTRARKTAGESERSFQRQHSQFASRPFAHRAEEREAPVGESSVSFSLADIDIFPREIIQPKLRLGPVGDRYEQEADSIAGQVVETISSSDQSPVQRNEDVKLQRKVAGFAPAAGGESIGPDLESSIHRARGKGFPLSERVRQPMERAFGADFSGVRVHVDGQADSLNRSIQARAFTTGQDIFLRQGEYRPASSEGQRLLAHELTHVMQQGRMKPAMQVKDRVSANNDSNAKTISDADPSSIQRYMLSNGDGANLVEEKFGLADFTTGIRFSKFSSCIGIVGTRGNEIVGAHLVRVGSDGNGPDIDSVTKELNGIDNGMMFGFLSNWEIGIRSEIAMKLGIEDWKYIETQNGWLVTWVNNAWVMKVS